MEETENDAARGPVKTFLGHVEDLRLTLIKMAVAVSIAMVLSFLKVKQIVSWYLWPLTQVPQITDERKFLTSLGVADSFTISIQIAFTGGLVLSAPFTLYFAAAFFLPALTSRERRYVTPILFFGILLFFLGAAFAYFWLLPLTLQFMFTEAENLGFRNSWSVSEYFSFVSNFVLSFALAFELPLVVLLLNRIGVLPSGVLRRFRRVAIIIIVIFAAVITPTGDAFTLMAMSVPLLLLYEACVWIAVIMEARDRRRAASS